MLSKGAINIHLEDHYPFEVKPLKYPYNGLEPYLDEQTLIIHHQGHYKKYVEKLNKALTPYPAYHSWNLESLLFSITELPEEIRHDVWVNGGGVYNHQLYFETMAPTRVSSSNQALNVAIQTTFQGKEEFMKKFKEHALNLVGSGYTFLVVDENGKLSIVSTANQDTTIPYNLCPILGIDLWEHAYYLKYQNRKEEYIDAWFKLVDWNQVAENYLECLQFTIDEQAEDLK